MLEIHKGILIYHKDALCCKSCLLMTYGTEIKSVFYFGGVGRVVGEYVLVEAL